METTMSPTQPNRTDVNDELLTIGEVAEMLRVPIGTLRYWRHLGTGPHSFKVGRWVRYRRGDVRAWVNAKRRGPAAS
jgi:excisionase family DNA binding protein